MTSCGTMGHVLRKTRWQRGPWLVALAMLLAGCSEDTSQPDQPLVDDPDAFIVVYVVQTLDPGTPLEQGDAVAVYNQTRETVVAVADAQPRVVPIDYGEPTADPTSDYMLVTVQIESDFIDDIAQVELNIDMGNDGEDDWCNPMVPDSIVPGSYYLKLQPACTDDERDPLTGDCVVSSVCDGYLYGCRQDRLTFTLWGDISSVCHGDSSTE